MTAEPTVEEIRARTVALIAEGERVAQELLDAVAQLRAFIEPDPAEGETHVNA